MPLGSTVPDARSDVFRGRLAIAAVLTFAAGVVHVAAAVPHFGDDALLGSAFIITGWAQIVGAALLLHPRPARVAVWAGVVIHVAALGALVASRTAGLPLGHGGVEPVTLPDATTAVLEIAALIVLAGWLRRPHPVGAPRPLVVGVMGIAGAVALGGSTVAVASLGTAGHGHGAQMADTHAADTPRGHDGNSMASHETGAATNERVHVHDDESIHVHTSGDGHEHTDGTMHVHAAPSNSGPTSQDTSSESHTHAPDEEHG